MSAPENVTIVVVDDDAGHIELVRRTLRRAGVSNDIVTISSGQEALEFVLCRGKHGERAPGAALLVMLDINMPGGLDGVEVLRQIKADDRAMSTPVMMLTTTDDPREVQRCYDLGCSVYVKKPIERTTFVEAIGRLGLFVSIVTWPSGAIRPS